MSKFTNAETDADDFAKLVNEDTEVTTRYGDNPKKSYPMLANEIQSNVDRLSNLYSATVYETTAAGLAETSDGNYFSVVSSDDDGYLDLYKNNASSAEFKKQYPSSEKVIETFDFVNDRIVDEAPIGYVYTVVDDDGYAAFGVKDDLTFKAVKFESDENQFLQESASESVGYQFVIEDAYGQVALGVKDDGSLDAASIDTKELSINGNVVDLDRDSSQDYLGNYDYNINHFMSYGQSLSIGATAYPVISSSQKYDSLTFFGGVLTSHPDDSAQYYSDFKPLIETNPADHEDGYLGGETPCSGSADSVKQLIFEENNIEYSEQNYKLLCSAPGEGGLSLAELSDGTVYFDQLKDNITNAYSLSQSKGLTYNVPAVSWTQGEEDNGISTPVTTYKAGLIQLLSDIDSHAKLTCGQSNDVQLICYQIQRFLSGGPLVQTALYELQRDEPNIHVATPMYIFDYSDNTHLTVPSSKWLGAYYGYAYKRLIVDGENWKPVQPKSHKKQGAILEVKFEVPRKPLVIDTDRVTEVDNYGFNIYQSDGTTEILINSVEVSQPDTVKIVAAETIPDGAILKYAYDNGEFTYGSRTVGARGNLRDSNGDSYIFDEDFLKAPMHNWCLCVPEYIL